MFPYRNRETQLKYYIKNTFPHIEETLPNSKIAIIEQAQPKPFNRGKILNVAFEYYKHKTKYFITNDVDVNPTKDTIVNYFSLVPNNNEIIGIYTSVCDTLGGVIKISSENIHEINGFPK